ncbi:hypothetical protein OHA21_12100 [Actinoplanes sp. NBC_00393]|uniref:hypothetical protein n=1 Tax=Actinoplanes sp. NBC_00393 TaxID=2975953 RepID=UPI002E1E463B
MTREPVPALPEPDSLLRELPEPALEIDEDMSADLRRIELRRAVLDIAEIGHDREVELVRAAVEQIRRSGERS